MGFLGDPQSLISNPHPGDFYSRGWGIFENLEIFIPGIFAESRESGIYNPRDVNSNLSALL